MTTNTNTTNAAQADTNTTPLFANRCGYTDTHPFEVIRQISPKCLEVREMTAERDTTGPELNFAIGGFLAHCTNQHEQKWTITPNENGRVVRIRLGKKGWKCAGGDVYTVGNRAVKFYDYNF